MLALLSLQAAESDYCIVFGLLELHWTLPRGNTTAGSPRARVPPPSLLLLYASAFGLT